MIEIDLGQRPEQVPVSAASYNKAKKAIREGLVVQDDQFPDVYWVSSLRAGASKPYRVKITDEYVTCTCTHGLNNPGSARCYHAEAVRLTKEQGADDDDR